MRKMQPCKSEFMVTHSSRNCETYDEQSVLKCLCYSGFHSVNVAQQYSTTRCHRMSVQDSDPVLRSGRIPSQKDHSAGCSNITHNEECIYQMVRPGQLTFYVRYLGVFLSGKRVAVNHQSYG